MDSITETELRLIVGQEVGKYSLTVTETDSTWLCTETPRSPFVANQTSKRADGPRLAFYWCSCFRETANSFTFWREWEKNRDEAPWINTEARGIKDNFVGHLFIRRSNVKALIQSYVKTFTLYYNEPLYHWFNSTYSQQLTQIQTTTTWGIGKKNTLSCASLSVTTSGLLSVCVVAASGAPWTF